MHNIIYGEMGHLKNQGFDDWIESVSIYGECRWLAYRAPNFEVYTYILRPNTDYFTPSTWGGYTDEISSVRPLPESGTETIVLFQYAHFGGCMVILKDSIDNLSTIDFNDATGSFIITGGNAHLDTL